VHHSSSVTFSPLLSPFFIPLNKIIIILGE